MQAQASSFINLIVVELAALLPASVAAAQASIFSNGFEWDDTGDWASTQPVRCDRLARSDRALTPSAVLHVATWGCDATGEC